MIKERFGESPQKLRSTTGRPARKKRSLRFAEMFSISLATSLLSTNVFMVNEIQALEDEVPLMEKVVVTATRQEEKIATIPANVTVISEQDIAKSPAATVPELLRSTAGVLVNDITGNGRSISIDLRGFGETAGSNTLLLIDGRRINQADLSGTDWTLIPKDRIQQIEIIHGGRGSVLYGDNAAGGVINIITKRGDSQRASVGTAIGSYQSLISNVGVSGSTEKLSYMINGNFQTSEGYRDNSDTNAKDVGLNFEYFASDRFTINLSGGFHKDDTKSPGDLLKIAFLDSGGSRTATDQTGSFSDSKDTYIQVSPKYFFTESNYFKLDASSRRTQRDVVTFWGVTPYPIQTEIDTLAVSPQLVLNNKIFGLNSKLNTGFDYNHSKVKKFTSPEAQISKDNYGYYGHAELSVTEALAISGGVRSDRVKFKFNPVGAGVADNSTMDETLYTAGVTFRVTENASTYFGYSKSFRYPLLDELHSPYFGGSLNTTLKQQTTDDFEIGAHVDYDTGLSLGINLFRLDTDQEIYLDTATFKNLNLDGKTIRQGVEFTASQQFSNFSLKGSYTLRDTKIDGGQYDGKDFPNVPKNQLTLGIESKLCKQVRLNMDGTYIGKRTFISDFDNTFEDQESYFNLNGKLSYLFDKGSAYLTINNILNSEYAEYGVVNGAGTDAGLYPSPKINFMAGLNLEFQ